MFLFIGHVRKTEAPVTIRIGRNKEVVNLYSLQDVPTIVYILLLRPSVIVTKEEGKTD